eukprot:TRINITY_DN396_c1_g1_i1.p1 TRINITY_DN396_c1_g1~~TRINITY_DN396_c1_g1_i1.p1  ORF type:complete len:398 (-),score=69.06 TRINITY_DN396_c1_g1_i1:6-1199(-)
MKITRRKKLIILILFTLSIIYLLYQEFQMSNIVLLSMTSNQIKDSLYCRFRKDPTVFHYGGVVLIVWETNCHDFILDLEWGKKGEMRQWVGKTDVTVIDETHFVQKVEIAVHDRFFGEYQFCLVDGKGYQSKVFDVSFNGEYPVKIGLVSDNQDGVGVFTKILGEVRKHDIDYFFHAGDIVSMAMKLVDWHHQWFEPLEKALFRGKLIPVSYTRGNHDKEYGYGYKYSLEKPLYYTTVMKNTRFIFLDTNVNSRQQLQWFESELKKDHKVKFTVVVCHIAPYIEYWEPHAWEEKYEKVWNVFMREKYVPLFERYKVDMVISGHSHIYQRGEKNGIMYTIIGGGGGSLEGPQDKVEEYNFFTKSYFDHHYTIMEILKDSIEMKTYSINNELVDKYTIQ